MLVQVLAVFTELPLWECYGIVGSGLVVLGGVWLAVGKSTTADPRRSTSADGEDTEGEWAMAHRADDIQQDIEDTQRDIDDTRSAMTEKLEMLGERVRETVEGAQASVEEMVENVRDTVDTTVAAVKQTVEGAQASMEGIVENVKGTVGDTVEAVQRTFDLHHQMEQHPWLMLSGSLFVGYLLGSGGNGRTSAAGSTTDAKSLSGKSHPCLV